eukprot:1563380-Prymnesium_polylepis.1
MVRSAVWLPWNRDDCSDRRAEGTLNILKLRLGWQLCKGFRKRLIEFVVTQAMPPKSRLAQLTGCRCKIKSTSVYKNCYDGHSSFHCRVNLDDALRCGEELAA